MLNRRSETGDAYASYRLISFSIEVARVSRRIAFQTLANTLLGGSRPRVRTTQATRVLKESAALTVAVACGFSREHDRRRCGLVMAVSRLLAMVSLHAAVYFRGRCGISEHVQVVGAFATCSGLSLLFFPASHCEGKSRQNTCRRCPARHPRTTRSCRVNSGCCYQRNS